MGLTLITIPLVSYGMTLVSLFLFPLCIAVAYSLLSALKRHHENQPFVDRHKVKTYTQLFASAKPLLVVAYWVIQGVGVYQVIG